MTMHRLILSYTEDPKHTITLDVFMNDNRIKRGYSVLGWMGKLSNKNPDLLPYPFVIADIKAGEMDFGGAFEQNDRFANLNIYF